jgi:ParB family chromosome partitioning protein
MPWSIDEGRQMTLEPERAVGGLGRGLASLIPPRPSEAAAPSEIALSRIRPNPFQPRRRFDAAELEQLAASIREHGVLQPVLVTEALDGYQLVAGERRVRAAELAGLERIPAVVRQLAARDQLELALVENLQREDLDPIETANAYRQLIDEFGFTQEQLAARVSKARSTVANTLRLLDLDLAVQASVADGRISEGHARALGGADRPAQAHLVRVVEERDLSVRETEELVRRLRDRADRASPIGSPDDHAVDADTERLVEDLRRALGTKVSLARGRRGGRIVIEFYDDEDLGRLYQRLTGGTA